MKYTITGIIFAFSLIFGCAWTPQPPIQPSHAVTLETQAGSLVAGTAGTATYRVTTTEIPDGTEGTITWFTSMDGTTVTATPAGISTTVTLVSSNLATITVTTTGSAIAGTYYFKLTENDIASSVATLSINATASPTVTVGSQVGVLTAGTGGTATYTVTTSNISSGILGSFTWFTSVSGTTATSAPAGVSASVTAISGNSATITMTVGTSTSSGTYYYKLTEDTATSAVRPLTIDPPKTVSVGSQTGTLHATIAGSVTFTATTTNVYLYTIGTVTWYTDASCTVTTTAPLGTTVSVSGVDNYYKAVVTVSGSAATVAGSYYFKLTESTAVSPVCTLTVTPAPTALVGSQTGKIENSDYDNATYSVVTSNVPDSTSGTIAWYTTAACTTTTTKPTGINVNLTSVSNNAMTITIFAQSNQVIGVYYFKLTVGNAVSSVVTLTVVLKTPNINIYPLTDPDPTKNCILVNWSGIVSATGYYLYRSTTSGILGVKVADLTPGNPQYYDRDIVSGTTYYYQAVAFDGSGHESDPSVQKSGVAP